MSRSSHSYPHPLSFGWFVNPSSHHPNQMCIIMILLITINNLICMPIEALSSTLEISVLIFSSSCSTSASSSVPPPPPLLHCSALTVVEKKSKDFLRSYLFFLKKKRGTFFAPQKRPASHWMACVLCILGFGL